MISHDVDLLADVVNKVWFLDAVRGEADVYNMGWQKYLDARATDEARRRRERANAEKKAAALRTGGQAGCQGDQGDGGAEHAQTRRAHDQRARRGQVADRTAKIRFPGRPRVGRHR